MPRNRSNRPNATAYCWLSFLFVATLLSSPVTFAQSGDGSRTPQSGRTPPQQQQAEDYHESSLRRFEIVTLVSLPFTAVHSFLAVRTFEMVRQREFAPDMSDKDFRVIGASAVSFALLIGIWDWRHTRGKDPSQPRIPKSPKSTSPTRDVGFNDWESEPSPGFLLPLVQVRF